MLLVYGMEFVKAILGNMDFLSMFYEMYKLLGENKYIDITSNRHFVCRYTCSLHTSLANLS